MKKETFNTYEFNLALKASKINPAQGIELFEQYLNSHPQDYSAYPFYAESLIIMGLLEQAENVLDQVSEESVGDPFFCSQEKKVDYLDRHLKFDRLKVLCYQERYEEVLDFCSKNKAFCDRLNVKLISLLCKKKLGLLPEEMQPFSYISSQLLDYSEEAFFRHIEKHFADNNIDLERPSRSVFAPGFPKDVIRKSISFIPSSKKLLFGFFEDTYVFRFDECGRSDNKLANCFKIIAFHNSQELITAYPALDCSEFPYTDLNDLRVENKPKVKSLSQIEKFYKRYGQRK